MNDSRTPERFNGAQQTGQIIAVHTEFPFESIGISRRGFLKRSSLFLGLLPFSGVGELVADAAKAPWFVDNLILSSHLFEKTPFFEMAPLITELIPESRRIDLWVDSAGNKTSGHYDEIAARGFPAAVEYCRANGLRLTTGTCYGKGYQAFAEPLRDLGCTLCIQSSGKVTSGSMTEMMKRELEGCKPALELAERYGCRIAIENHGGNFLLSGLDSFKAFMDLNTHPLLGIAFAPFHTQGREAPPEVFLGECATKVFYFYAWQRNPAGKTMAEQASGEAQFPGIGPLDFGPMFAILKSKCPDVLISPFMHRAPGSARSVELARKSIAYLSAL